MKLDTSGKIYRFPLDFEMGYGYAEQDDFSDTYTFDGILISVFKIIDTSIRDRSVEEIKQASILFGPVPIYRYPPSRGKGAWKQIGKTTDFLIKEWPEFKDLQSLETKKDWSELSKWFKVKRNNHKVLKSEYPYEKIRHLETTILNSGDGIASKITMMQIIEKGESVGKYYDLKLLENRNIYVQIVNTYYEKKITGKLLDIVDDL